MSDGTYFCANIAHRIPMGTFMMNIQCQERVSVRIPPNVGPNAAPMDEPNTDRVMANIIILGGKNFTANMIPVDASIAEPIP